eukprot:CAMPEP_0185282140 /NCGR_PEP_ID=MMETSP1359-20130426/67106_1 /TAXON_ID=552665 /ORGANISM="Bigelowiella longifila, Strain CCMP242" /LENGTH=80 /DNA_ID=CAMNT_0027877647 /DNA_START=712 /DNA_END=954 /DNA_ORIENTATION=-
MHRLTVVALLIASKFHDDNHCSNKLFADVGGVSLEELNASEIDFLFRIQFDLKISISTYEIYRIFIERYKRKELDRIVIS